MPIPRSDDWNACAVPWIHSVDGRRQLHLRGRLVDLLDRLAQRDAGLEVERDGHRGELSQVIDRERTDAGVSVATVDSGTSAPVDERT